VWHGAAPRRNGIFYVLASTPKAERLQGMASAPRKPRVKKAKVMP
jgi:hypothetical protein